MSNNFKNWYCCAHEYIFKLFLLFLFTFLSESLHLLNASFKVKANMVGIYKDNSKSSQFLEKTCKLTKVEETQWRRDFKVVTEV